jgi:hypothetical protein
MRIRITNAYQTSVTLYGAYPFNIRRMAAQRLTVLARPDRHAVEQVHEIARKRRCDARPVSKTAAGGRAGAQVD